jgi:hypothetical protein
MHGWKALRCGGGSARPCPECPFVPGHPVGCCRQTLPGPVVSIEYLSTSKRPRSIDSSMSDSDGHYDPPDDDFENVFPQQALMAKLTAHSPDPVGELVALFGVARRTAERWNNGQSRMAPGLRVKLLHALDRIRERQVEFEALDEHDRLFTALAAGRLKTSPVD